MDSINELVERFRALLVSSWTVIEQSARENRDENFLTNWFQANWEMMLEGDLSQRLGHLVVLAPYGDGAEGMYYGVPDGTEVFDRVSLPTVRPNYIVVGLDKGVVRVECAAPRYAVSVFGAFLDDGRFKMAPPFDVCILTDDEGVEHAVNVDLLDYWLVPLAPNEE